MNKKLSFFQSIHFKFALIFALLILITLEIIGVVFVKQLEKQNVDNFESSIQVPVSINNQISTALTTTNTQKANTTIKRLIFDVDATNISEIQVIDSKGIIRGINNANEQNKVGQRTTDSDIKEAIYRNRKRTQVVSNSQQGRYYTVILPLTTTNNDNNQVVGAIYIRASMEKVYRDINDIILIFLLASLVASLLSAVVAILVARAITQPIDEMKKQAIRMADGDYSGQVRIYGQDELGQLAAAVNNLSIRVEDAQETSESERRRLDSVLTHMTDGVIATDRRGNVAVINEKALEFLEITTEEAMNQSILKVLGIEDEYSLRDLLEEQHEVDISIDDLHHRNQHDMAMIQQYNTIIHADFSLIQRDTGFVSGLVCVLHDVTEQQKNEREQQEFVSNVSHELRTPLTSVRSYLEALNDGAWEDPKVAPQFLKVSMEEADRMIRMINDLLTLSRMDRKKTQMDMEFTNLNAFLNYILDRFDMMLKNDSDKNQTGGIHQKVYSIKREFLKRDIWCEIDTDKMMQVIDNIMNNAIKYSPDGGVITARLMESQEQVVISISDQGLGIPRQDLTKVFDRFYRVDKARSRKQGGTGLGLAISKEVVEAHGGHIWVDSREGHGSTFFISLPYQDYDDEGDDWDETD